MSDRLEAVSGGDSELGQKRGFSGWISGRARRREYWPGAGFFLTLTVVLAVVAPGSELLAAIPVTLFMIRRLHDLGRTGLIAILINLITNVVGLVEAFIAPPQADSGLAAGGIFLVAFVVLGALPGQKGHNRFDPQPGTEDDLSETCS